MFLYRTFTQDFIKTFVLLSMLGVFFLHPISVFAITYQPGETLDPACLPTDVSCTVATSVPGGLNTQIQFNNNGFFGGSSGLTFDSALSILQGGTPSLSFTITSPDKFGAGDSGQQLTVKSGNGQVGGGPLFIAAGNAAGGIGGDLTIQSGNGGTAGAGGNLILTGGTGASSGHGGNIKLAPGTSGSGSVGTISFLDPVSGNAAIFDLSSLGANRTFTFPSIAGTFALGTGSSGNCAEWSGANSLVSSSVPCDAWTATTTLPNLTTLANLTSIGTITTGAWNGTTIDIPYGGTGTSTAPTYGAVLVGNAVGGYDYVATSSLGNGSTVWGNITGSISNQIDLQTALDTKLSLASWFATTTDALSQGSINKYYSTNLFAIDLAGTTTSALAEGTNLYFTNARANENFAINFAGTTTSALAEGSNLYFTNDRADARLLATTSLTNITTLTNLSLPATQLTDFGTPFYQFFSATTTSALAEGTNLYFTNDRVASVFAGTTTDALAEGVNNVYFTTTRADKNFAINLAGTTTTALAEGTNLYFTNDRVASVLAGTTTDALAEGVTNKYYSTNLFAIDLAGTTTSALAEGTNLYFTNARANENFAINFAGTTTSALAEGSNLYFTNARSDSRFITDLAATTSVNSITTLSNLSLPATQLTDFGTPFYQFFSATTTTALAEGTNLYFTNARANENFAINLAATTTSALAEGSNLYYTDARTRNALSVVGSPLIYSTSTGVFDITQAATGTSGYLTATDWNTFNDKQAALGFIPEDVANKSTDVSLGTSNILYPTQNAVKTYVDNNAIGLNWKTQLEAVNVIANSATPVATTVEGDAYIIDTGGNTGVWAPFLPGDIVQYQFGAWAKLRSLIIGDRFGIALVSTTTPFGAFTGFNNYVVGVASGTPGAFNYTNTAPVNGDARFVSNASSTYHGISFTYSGTLSKWVQLSASVNISYGNGLQNTSNVLSLGDLTSDWNQAGAFNIITAGGVNASTFTGDGSGLTNLNANNLINFGTPFYNFFSATTTSALAEGTNLYFTNARVQSFIDASSTIPKTYTTNTFTGGNTFTNSTTTNATTTSSFATTASSTNLFTSNLSVGSLSGFLKATAGLVSTALVNLASDITGILGVGNGGTGWGSLAANTLLVGNGAGSVATTSAGTNGQVLALVSGVPTWVATTSLSSISGTLSVTQGGTGLTSVTNNQLLIGGPGNTVTQIATSSLGLLTTNIAEGTNLYFTNTRVNTFIDASSTIPKTYTANNFLLQNTFSSLFATNASTTNATTSSLYIDSLNGPLQANAGLVSATTSIGVLYGGTGATSFGQGWLFSLGGTGALSASTSPTVNYITATSTTATSTFANGIKISGGCFAVNGNCIPNSTSTLGIGTTGQVAYFSGTNTAVGTSSLFITTSGTVGIGTTSPAGILDVSGSSNSTSLATFVATRAFSIINTDTTNNNASGFDFRTNDVNGALSSGAKIFGVYTSHAANAVSGELAFMTKNAGTIAESMRITAAGNVGIGTTTPFANLSVQANNGATNKTLFAIGSSTQSATTTLFSVSNTGSTTIANGVNITNGCFAKNGVCIGQGSDLQFVTSYKANDTFTNIPTGGATTTLTTISITPSTATGDILVRAGLTFTSSNAADQPFDIAIKQTDCTGTTLQTTLFTIAAAVGAEYYHLDLNYVAVDPGASAQTYALCVAVVSGAGDTDVIDWNMSGIVIDTGADLAEVYTTNDASIEPGDVVSLDPSLKTGIQKTTHAYDKNVLGIVSTRPGSIIGGVDKEGVRALPVALSGRVPVKVSTENGSIVAGDYLTPSSAAGVAMKAMGVGPIIGQAMWSYSGEDVGMVMAFVKNFGSGDITALMGDVSASSTTVAAIQSETAHDPVAIITKKIADGVQFFTDLVVGRVTAIRGYFGEVFAKKVHTDELCLKKSDGTEACITGDQVGVVTATQGLPTSEVSTEPPPAEDVSPDTATSTTPAQDSSTTTPDTNAP